MLNDLTERKLKTVVSYSLCFDDGRNNGYAFPCDADGNVSEEIQPDAVKNLEYCLAHPEKFVRSNEVVQYKRICVEPAYGTCSCGETVILENQYCGACECPGCGQWYNLFGEEILPPDQWQD